MLHQHKKTDRNTTYLNFLQTLNRHLKSQHIDTEEQVDEDEDQVGLPVISRDCERLEKVKANAWQFSINIDVSQSIAKHVLIWKH